MCDLGEYPSMDLAVLGLTSEQATFAFIMALALFFLYLQLKRFARIGANKDTPRDPDESKGELDGSGESKP